MFVLFIVLAWNLSIGSGAGPGDKLLARALLKSKANSLVFQTICTVFRSKGSDDCQYEARLILGLEKRIVSNKPPTKVPKVLKTLPQLVEISTIDDSLKNDEMLDETTGDNLVFIIAYTTWNFLCGLVSLVTTIYAIWRRCRRRRLTVASNVAGDSIELVNMA